MSDNKENIILKYINDTITIKGYSPTVREIGQAVGLKSTSTVHAYLVRLKEKGLITVYPDAPRTIRIKTNTCTNYEPTNLHTFFLKDHSIMIIKEYCKRNKVDENVAIERALQLLSFIRR